MGDRLTFSSADSSRLWRPETHLRFRASVQEMVVTVYMMFGRDWSADGEEWHAKYPESSFDWTGISLELVWSILGYACDGGFGPKAETPIPTDIEPATNDLMALL